MYEMDKGLIVAVYRSGEFKAKGPKGYTVIGVAKTQAQKGKRKFVPLPRESRVFLPSEERPAAVLVLSNLRGAPPALVPLDIYESGKWYMSGGNLADWSDGRWQELVQSFQPKAKELGLYLASSVDIHDRVES